VDSVVRGLRHDQLGLRKVVLARAVEASLAQPLDLARSLARLADTYSSCTVFALGHADACFLGATPERLIALHDGTASTMALAGSTGRGASLAQDELLASQLLSSPKEQAEHAIVVGALRDGLAQVCTRIIADAQPRVQKLANVQHLLTPIRGQVAPGRDVFDLVARLHPTPAVGGYPSAPALALIRAAEGLDRGWYAGPIGWVDRHGEGEFVVGIRSALVRGDSATLFAGCGIVADSDPAAELAESDWKLRPMLAALGLAAAALEPAR
jgi:isochorismate synthase